MSPAVEKALAYYARGEALTLGEAAERFEITIADLQPFIQRAPTPRPPNGEYHAARNERIVELHKSGLTLAQVADRLRLSPGAVRAVLLRRGLMPARKAKYAGLGI